MSCWSSIAWLGCGAGLGALAASQLSDGRKQSRAFGSASPTARFQSVGDGEHDRTCEWLNDFVRILWPRVDDFLRIVLEEQIMPAIHEAVPRLRGAIRVQRLTLGQVAPRFSGFRVKERSDNAIVLDVNVDVVSELDVQIKAVGLPLGVRQFTFRGVLTVVFRPKVARPPFFGGVEVYFINPPDLDMDFTGAANVADWKLIHNVIQTAIQNALGQALVIPSRVVCDLLPEDDIDEAELRCPAPLGVLRLLVKGASGLKAKDMSLTGPPSSDPYVTVRVGQQVWRSQTQKQTLAPVWSHGNVCDFLVYDRRQRVQIVVYDEDRITSDDLLGVAAGFSLEEASNAGGRVLDHTLQLTLDDGPAGELLLSTRWLTLSEEIPVSGIPAAVARGPSQLVLSAKVLAATGLPPDSQPPFVPPFVVRFAAGKGHAADTARGRPAAAPAQFTEQLQRICGKLAEERRSLSDIAAITGLAPQQVEMALAQSKDPKAAAVIFKEWSQLQAATNPCFNEVVRLLLPWTSEMMERAEVILELRDSKGRCVGERFSMMLKDVVRRDVPVQHTVLPGAVLRAHLSTRWLQAS